MKLGSNKIIKTSFWVLLPLCLVFWVYKFFTKKVTLTEHAKSTLECIEAGDSGCIFSRMSTEEIESCGYNEQNVKALLLENILPVWKSLKRAPDISTQMLSDQGVASRAYVLPNGFNILLVVDSMSDGDKPTIVFSDLILSSLNANFCIKNPNERNSYALLRGKALELKALKPRLKSLEVKGTYYRMPMEGKTRFVKLEECITNLLTAADDLETSSKATR